MSDHLKEILTVIGFLIWLLGFFPYIKDVLQRKTKPHSFSWFIWFLLTGIAFFGQLADQGGIGSWITATNSIACLIVFILSLRHGENIITRSDWITFIFALLAIPLWGITHTPLYSMILVTIIDMLGFYPTFRKSWYKPEEETIKAYWIAALVCGIGIIGLEHYTLITVLYPASLVMTNSLFVVYILWRRNVLKENHDH